MLVAYDHLAALYPIDWSRDGQRLLAAEGSDSECMLCALLITPARDRTVTLSPTFSEIDGLSRDGRSVLGWSMATSFSVSATGQMRVLARASDNAAWNQ